MKLNWRDSFKEESNNRLFEIFSEKNRINIEPQIFAGNILFDRNYELEKLKTAKNELIDSIEESFGRKYYVDPKKIKKENVIKEITLKTLLAAGVYVMFYNLEYLTFSILTLTFYNKSIALFWGLICFLPLIRLKRSNEKAVEKVEMEIERKNKLINKIETELRF